MESSTSHDSAAAGAMSGKPRQRLRKMQVNQRGMISAIMVKGELGRRIRDMGLVPGTEITVIGRAPLKDPVALRLRGCTLTLRNNEADYIFVDIEQGPGA